MASQVRISSQGIVSMPDSVVATAKLADGAVTPVKTGGGYSAQTTTYVATANDRVIDCTSGTFQVTIPAASSNTGRLLTVRNSGSGAITLGRTGADTIGGATSQVLNGKGSIEIVSSGSAWNVVRGTYTDETIGRRIFTWDDVNSRFQLTWGDTGWRDITSTLGALPSGLDWSNVDSDTVLLRRVGSTVSIGFGYRYLKVTGASGSGTWGAAFIPAGFRSTGHAVAGFGDATGHGYAEVGLSGYHGTATFIFNWSGMTIGSLIPISFTYTTTDAWPVSLPGSASGTIPNG